MKNIDKKTSSILLKITAAMLIPSLSSRSVMTTITAFHATPTVVMMPSAFHHHHHHQQQRKWNALQPDVQHHTIPKSFYSTTTTTTTLMAKPKKGNIVDTYQTVSVNCSKCRTRLFRYKKKNGTKSNLIKCYIERIAEDSANILASREEEKNHDDGWHCPNCNTKFARSSMIHGRPALKLVGGKVRMTKK